MRAAEFFGSFSFMTKKGVCRRTYGAPNFRDDCYPALTHWANL
jgi:hypothetical protein